MDEIKGKLFYWNASEEQWESEDGKEIVRPSADGDSVQVERVVSRQDISGDELVYIAPKELTDDENAIITEIIESGVKGNFGRGSDADNS